eukprot:Sspe_Gene.96448::Locus_69159_Transcript_1_1_Confidence_1.000_Length_1185::g.96448::m.96448
MDLEAGLEHAQHERPGSSPVADMRSPIDTAMPEALEFPRPPTLPKRYFLPGELTKWEKIWVPVEDPTMQSVLPNCSKITDYLFLGNMLFTKDLKTLQEKGITHILTLTKRKVPDDVKAALKCHQIIIHDTPNTPISDCFPEAFKHILDARDSGGKVLVHCRAGVSRGSCCVMAYLMKYYKKSLRSVYEYVKKCRPIAHPNKGFLAQLRRLEIEIFGTEVSNINMDDLPYTMWERAEHLGLNNPIPSTELCIECERRVAEEYRRRFKQPNPYLTMDAGLGGKMELHPVELYWPGDFEWIDQIIVDVLYTNRPKNSNYQSKRSRKLTGGSQSGT